jgi:hypothetical protein
MINEEQETTLARYYQADTVDDSQQRTDAFAEYVKTRTDWPRLQLAPNEHGNWDIVLRLDGGYGRERAEEMLRYTAVQVARHQFPEANLDAA